MRIQAYTSKSWQWAACAYAPWTRENACMCDRPVKTQICVCTHMKTHVCVCTHMHRWTAVAKRSSAQNLTLCALT